MGNVTENHLKKTDKWNGLLHLYKSGIPIKEIAEELHISQTSLYSKIKELGLKRERCYKRKSIDVELFKELIELGIPGVEIANRLNICTDTVIKLKKKYGYATEDEQKISKGRKGAICRMYYKHTGIKPYCHTSSNVLGNHASDIMLLLKNGISKTEIAKRYGVCTSTVYNFIHLYDIDAPIKKICDGKEQQIKEAFNAGDSITAISQKLRCHTNTISRTIKKMKLLRAQNIIKRKSILNSNEDKIKELYNKGFSGAAIAKQMGVSQQCVYNFFHRKQMDLTQRKVKYCSTFYGHDDELIKMRQEGMTLKQIGDYFGVKANTVLYRIRKIESGNGEYKIV